MWFTSSQRSMDHKFSILCGGEKKKCLEITQELAKVYSPLFFAFYKSQKYSKCLQTYIFDRPFKV